MNNENLTICGLKIKNINAPAMIIREPQRGFHQIIIYPIKKVRKKPVGLSFQFITLPGNLDNTSDEPNTLGPNKHSKNIAIRIP